MIPDELIERALHAYYAGAGVSHSTEVGMRSALEAVAAGIWDDGYESGAEDAIHAELDGRTTNSPYRAT